MTKFEKYVAEIDLPVSIDEAFAYHERHGALQRLTPPWESVHVEHSDQSLQVGSRVVLKTKIFGIPVRWVAEHTEYDPPHLFADKQVSGPFKSWNHRHEFTAHEANCQLRDKIEYEVPFGTLGRWLGKAKARGTIEAMFAYRHRLTRDDLEMASRYPLAPLKIAISGCSGLVGSELSSMLTLLGHQVFPIVRSPDPHPNSIAAWTSEDEAYRLAEMDAVIHLAGKSIASSRWTDAVKKEIRDSRLLKTKQLCQSLARLTDKPAVMICASATGIYGDRGDEVLNEDSGLGNDFLAEVAEQWEESCQPAVDAGIRVANARFGLILSPKGGALQKTLTPAKLMGGALGNGTQWWSWIALDDVLAGIYHVLASEELSGPINFVAPESMRNQDFAKTLGSVLNRPALIPAPATGLRLALGEMADSLLLASTRAIPQRLLQSGFSFRFPDLEGYLRYGLGKERLVSRE